MVGGDWGWLHYLVMPVSSCLGLVLNLIGITEIKQQIEKDFITNVDINDYHLYTQPSKGAAGGVAIYANNKLDHFRRDYLDIVNDELSRYGLKLGIMRSKTFYVAVPIDIPTVTFLTL